jgi:hypothetical protein
MKALSVRQPWADLVARGAKAVETRSWRTSYRGALAIQASTTSSMYERARAMGSQFIRARGGDSFRRLPRGAVICTCRLVDCVPVDSAAVLRVLRERPDEAIFGDFSAGRWAWLLADVQRLEAPAPARGRLGLWEWEGTASGGASPVWRSPEPAREL